jgi:hypothetical protein
MHSVNTHGAKFHDIVGEDLVPLQMKEKVDAAKRYSSRLTNV